MTKEELEKEAVEYAEKINLQNVNISGVVRNYISQAHLAGAEPRERQIEIDAKQIRALQKQNGELTDELTKKSDTNHQLVEQLAKLNERCSELEAQIEKMKHDVMRNVKWADQNKNGQMYCKLNAMINQWEIKE